MFKKFLLAAAALTVLSVGANAASLSCNPAIQNWVNGSKTTCTVVDQNSNNQKGLQYSPPSDTIPVREIDVVVTHLG